MDVEVSHSVIRSKSDEIDVNRVVEVRQVIILGLPDLRNGPSVLLPGIACQLIATVARLLPHYFGMLQEPSVERIAVPLYSKVTDRDVNVLSSSSSGASLRFFAAKHGQRQPLIAGHLHRRPRPSIVQRDRAINDPWANQAFFH
jgi:hypothetical protein